MAAAVAGSAVLVPVRAETAFSGAAGGPAPASAASSDRPVPVAGFGGSLVRPKPVSDPPTRAAPSDTAYDVHFVLQVPGDGGNRCLAATDFDPLTGGRYVDTQPCLGPALGGRFTDTTSALADQTWMVTDVRERPPGHEMTIRLRGGVLCLTSVRATLHVVAAPCTGTADQVWISTPVGANDLRVFLVNVGTGLAVTTGYTVTEMSAAGAHRAVYAVAPDDAHRNYGALASWWGVSAG